MGRARMDVKIDCRPGRKKLSFYFHFLSKMQSLFFHVTLTRETNVRAKHTHAHLTHTQFKLYYPIRKSTAVSSFSCLISPAHTLLSYGVTSTDFDPLAVHENHSYTVNHLTRRFAQDLTCLQKCTFFRSFLLLKHYNCSIAFKKSYYNTRLSQQKKP